VIRKLTLRVNDVMKLFCKRCYETYHLGTSARKESDIPLIKSGVFNSFTSAAPILISFENKNFNSQDYNFDGFYRPGHADFVANKKYKSFNDYRGGGHFSGRLTLALVAAGVVAAKATANYATYGVLYNWHAAMAGAGSSNSTPSGVQGICPDGWHLPSDAEWTQLEGYLGENAGGKLKEAGYDHWQSPNEGANNESGFTALPGGGRYYGGSFLNRGYWGFWWSSTEYDSYNAWYRSLGYNYSHVDRSSSHREFSFSIRCVRD